MIRLHVVVEGLTEKTFVDELLYPLLLEKGLWAIPHSMDGNVRWSRLKSDVVLLLKQNASAYVTTFFDYYGLVHRKGAEFPGKASLGKFDEASRKKRAIEDAIYAEVAQALGGRLDASHFIPYVQMHEFEGLLFSDPDRAAAGMYRPDIAPSLRAIRQLFATPEDINDDRTTAPSKRIEHILPGYDKPTLGNLAALEIGLDRLRAACPLFDGWLTKLLSLG